MYQEYRQTKGIVEEVLKKYPETRNSDRQLYIRVFEKCGLVLTPEQRRVFFKMPVTFETIGRSRRIIQNKEKKYQADTEVIKARQREKEAMHDEALSKEEKLKRLAQQGVFG